VIRESRRGGIPLGRSPTASCGPPRGQRAAYDYPRMAATGGLSVAPRMRPRHRRAASPIGGGHGTDRSVAAMASAAARGRSQQLCLRQVLDFILCRIHEQFFLNRENPAGWGYSGVKNPRIALVGVQVGERGLSLACPRPYIMPGLRSPVSASVHHSRAVSEIVRKEGKAAIFWQASPQ
jgi:hypothetical protein